MTDLPDWAKDRAREWYRKIWPGAPKDQVDLDVPIIAAALVVERERTLAEVRRVVSECSLISEEARRALLGGIEHV